MKKLELLSIFLLLCSILISGCTTPSQNQEKQKSIQEKENEKFAEELFDSFENPPEATKKEDVEISLGSSSTIADLLIGKLWKDAANVGMDISFTEDAFIYHIDEYVTAQETWILIDDCGGESNPNGPYIQRGEGEFSDCYLIVKLNKNELLLEYQGINIIMEFRR